MKSIKIVFFLLLLAVQFAKAQDTSVMVSAKMFDKFNDQLSLANDNAWLFRPGDDSNWARPHIDIAGWIKMNLTTDSQDIGRVLLNLFNNAFYASAERSRSTANQQKSNNLISYEPAVSVTTKKSGNSVSLPLVIMEMVFPNQSKKKYFSLSSLQNRQDQEPDWD